MSDPFAVHFAFASLQQFLEHLVGELRVRRGPLEGALSDLLIVWDAKYGRHELAVRLDAVGAAVRAAGLADEVRRLYAARGARAGLPGGHLAGFALLDAAADDDTKRVVGLLAMLHDKYPNSMPDARHTLGRVAEQLLVVWCDHHAKDFPARFRGEVNRLGLDVYRVEQWHLDHSPKLSPAAALVLDRLLDGGPFAVPWLDEVPDLSETDDGITDGVTDTPDAVSGTITDEVKVAPPPSGKSKGKNIDARMLKVMAESPASHGWSARQWAAHLNCSDGTVKATETWKVRLRAARAMHAADAVRRMDRHRRVRADRHAHGLEEVEDRDD